jgi:hypothetical protein
MAYNYLPFARRIYVPASPNRFTVPREAFSSGLGSKAYLSDLSIDFVADSRGAMDYSWAASRVQTENVLIRVGVFGRPYMTEEFYPIALFADKQIDEFGVWRLPKPYTIFPGERLKARIVYSPGGTVEPLPSDAYPGYWATWPSIAFFGIKRNTNHPCVLYDTLPSTFNPVTGVFANPPLGNAIVLQGERLQCAKDSPIDIYAVKDSTGNSRGDSPHATQIMSPDGRKWWENDLWPGMLRPTFVVKNLDKPEWVLQPDETIQVEIINPMILNLSTQMVLTLRGQLEVAV